MNDSTNSTIEEQLPDGLQQAIAATNRLVPDRESESRVVKLAMSISTVPAAVVAPEHGRRNGMLFRMLAVPIALSVLTLLIPWSFEIAVAGHLHPKDRIGGEWFIAADIPTDKIARIAEATSKKEIGVRWVRKSKPEKELKGQLSTFTINNVIKQSGRFSGSQIVVPIEINPADFDQPLTHLHAGEEVALVIPCGKTTLGYVCLHKLIEFAQLNLFF